MDNNDQLQAVYDRVEKGIAWLTANDPTGAFHLWFQSGIQPFAAMPAQEEARREDYRKYHKNRTVFESLWRQMENLEAAAKGA
jgi:DNA polymerase III psi subunit